jgi:hypothetical protein
MRFYRRLADVPGINYTGSPRVQRVRLPGHDLKPTINRSDFAGRQHEYAIWSYSDGTSSSASPAKNWLSQPPPESATPAEILQHLREVLELPGDASDYHFAIQGCFERLWTLRHRHALVVEEVETLCWLDIRLLEALPDTLRFEQAGGTFVYARSIAFERLVQLYERNGYLAEALDVAQRATRFHADDTILKPLLERLARIEAEHGG